MDFLKRHYEKILLIAVLLGLGGAAWWLQGAIQEAKQELEASVNVPEGQAKQPAPIDLSAAQAQLEKLKDPPLLLLSGDHNLFNPVTWKKTSSNDLLKIVKEGPSALTIKNIRPLYTVITYKRPAGAGFYLGIEQQSMRKPDIYAKVNDKQKLFIVREAKGPAEDPSELVLELVDTQEKVKIKKGEAYQRIDGYAADLRYDPDTKKFDDRRVGQTITFSGETYKIVAITKNEVTVQANSTTKKTTIKWNGTP